MRHDRHAASIERRRLGATLLSLVGNAWGWVLGFGLLQDSWQIEQLQSLADDLLQRFALTEAELHRQQTTRTKG